LLIVSVPVQIPPEDRTRTNVVGENVSRVGGGGGVVAVGCAVAVGTGVGVSVGTGVAVGMAAARAVCVAESAERLAGDVPPNGNPPLSAISVPPPHKLARRIADATNISIQR